MSFYATITGELSYKKQEDFDNALNVLEDEKWIKDGFFLDETDDFITDPEDDPNIDEENRVIYVPLSNYRNMVRLFIPGSKILEGSKGKIVWASTDGCFEGGVIIDGIEKLYSLEQWAKSQNMEGPPSIEDFDNYCEWTNEVEEAFFDEHGE